MGQGLVDMAREVTKDPQMMTSYDRGDDLPTVSGQQPAGMLADDILNDRPDRVTGLIVEASNPLLACSNPDGRLDGALASLELLVSIVGGSGGGGFVSTPVAVESGTPGVELAVGNDLPKVTSATVPGAGVEVTGFVAISFTVDDSSNHLVDVRIDYSRKTAFIQGVVRTNLGRFSLGQKARFVGRAVKRHFVG